MKMSVLQELAVKNALPAVIIKPIPSEVLPKEIREKQAGSGTGHSNENLYVMLAASFDHRGTVSLHRKVFLLLRLKY